MSLFTLAEEKINGSIKLNIGSPLEGDTAIKRCAAIGGGISWPTHHKAPAYMCILGQSYYDSPAMNHPKGDNVQIGPRFLLVESESRDPSLLGFWKMTVILANQSLCKTFYTEMPQDRLGAGYLKDFYRMAREEKANVHLCDAYDANNFMIGFSQIGEDIIKGTLLIPNDSIIYEQLQSITRHDLKNSPENSFYAINALSHIVSSFDR